jgi:hypothetical protein
VGETYKRKVLIVTRLKIVLDLLIVTMGNKEKEESENKNSGFGIEEIVDFVHDIEVLT